MKGGEGNIYIALLVFAYPIQFQETGQQALAQDFCGTSLQCWRSREKFILKKKFHNISIKIGWKNKNNHGWVVWRNSYLRMIF